MRANNESLMADDLHEDPGFYLWETIHRELKQNEFGFKASMGEFDRLIKSKMTIQAIREKHRIIDPRYLPMYRENVPWNGCKFVAAVVIHLSSSAEELQSKIISVTSTSRSLGGCTIPSQKIINNKLFETYAIFILQNFSTPSNSVEVKSFDNVARN
jgi:hypothetical protein